MSDMFTFKFGSVEVAMDAGDAKETKFSIPSELLKVVEEKHFWNLRTQTSAVNRILTSLIDDKDPKKLYQILARTDVVEQLGSAKKAEIHRIVSDGRYKGDRQWRMQKNYTKSLLTIGDIISVQAPSVAGVDGIEMQVLSAKGLWVELNSENLVYLAKTTRAQHAAGGVDKGMRRGVKRPNADAVTEEGDDNVHESDIDEERNEDDGMSRGDVEFDGTDPNEGCSSLCGVEVDVGPREPSCSSEPPKKRQSSLFEMFQGVGS